MREALEQTRFIRMRPQHEWGALRTSTMPRPWLTIIGEILVGIILFAGIVMAI